MIALIDIAMHVCMLVRDHIYKSIIGEMYVGHMSQVKTIRRCN
jgi:hypothetical protein